MLVLDVLRVLSSTPQAAAAYTHRCSAELEAASAAAAQLGRSSPAGRALGHACTVLSGTLLLVESVLRATVAGGAGSAAVQVGARELAFAMARLFVGGEVQGHGRWRVDPCAASQLNRQRRCACRLEAES